MIFWSIASFSPSVMRPDSTRSVRRFLSVCVMATISQCAVTTSSSFSHFRCDMGHIVHGRRSICRSGAVLHLSRRLHCRAMFSYRCLSIPRAANAIEKLGSSILRNGWTEFRADGVCHLRTSGGLPSTALRACACYCRIFGGCRRAAVSHCAWQKPVARPISAGANWRFPLIPMRSALTMEMLYGRHGPF